MKEIEDRIKTEYQNMTLPDNNMVSLVKSRIENGNTVYAPESSRMLRNVRRVVAAAVIVLVVLCTSGTIYAAVNGLTIGQMFTLLWNGKVPEKIQDTISCEATVIKEKNSFENILIKPVRVIGDVRGLYVVLEVTASESGENEMFRDYDITYDKCGSASYSMQMLGRTGDVSYIALKYIGGGDGVGVAESGRIEVCLTDWYRYDGLENGEPCIYEEDEAHEEAVDSGRLIARGEYKTVITYDYMSNDTVIRHQRYDYNVSAFTVTVTTDNEEMYYDMLENSDYLNVTLTDGSVVEAWVDYGLESEDTYTIIYSMSVPVNPEEVVGCEQEAYENETDN